MNSDRIKMLEGILKSGISPILLEDFPVSVFQDAVILESNCDVSDLNGHYEDVEFCPPEWYKKLTSKDNAVLVINNINKIPTDEQIKFVELFKYNKISTFELPKNCLVIVTCSDLTANKINEEVYSLLAQI